MQKARRVGQEAELTRGAGKEAELKDKLIRAVFALPREKRMQFLEGGPVNFRVAIPDPEDIPNLIRKVEAIAEGRERIADSGSATSQGQQPPGASPAADGQVKQPSGHDGKAVDAESAEPAVMERAIALLFKMRDLEQARRVEKIEPAELGSKLSDIRAEAVTIPGSLRHSVERILAQQSGIMPRDLEQLAKSDDPRTLVHVCGNRKTPPETLHSMASAVMPMQMKHTGASGETLRHSYASGEMLLAAIAGNPNAYNKTLHQIVSDGRVPQWVRDIAVSRLIHKRALQIISENEEGIKPGSGEAEEIAAMAGSPQARHGTLYIISEAEQVPKQIRNAALTVLDDRRVHPKLQLGKWTAVQAGNPI